MIDQVPKIQECLGKHTREIFSAICCIVSFLLGLMYTTQGGIYVFQMFDYYVAR